MTASTIHRVECDRCEEHASDTVSIQDGHEVCSGCLSRYYTTCDECGEYVEVTFSTVGDNEVCDSCSDDFFVTCDSCGLLTNSTEPTADHSDVCQHCAITEYWLCDGCDELIDTGERCTSCSRNGLIHEYSYKPSPLFHGEGTLFLGVELEINVPYRSLREIAAETQERLGNLAYLKEEESVQEGFEVVTHPMSYQWAMTHFPWDLLEHLRRRNADGEEAGLHIHISRAGFSGPCHVYRWMKLLYRNAEQLTTVARRVSEQWARFDTYDRRCVKHFAKGGKGSRYQAINTRNDHTFELRVFASSLQPREVQAALGLAAASVEYTRPLTVSAITHHEGWHWSSFVAWLQQHPEYAPLRRELEALACVC